MDDLYVVIFYTKSGLILKEVECFSLLDAMDLKCKSHNSYDIEDANGVVINDI